MQPAIVPPVPSPEQCRGANHQEGRIMDTVTTGQAARLLDVSEQTIRRYIADGTIPAVRLQDDAWYRIERRELERWAQSRGIALDWAILDQQ